VLFLVAGAVLLIACANLAILLLARAAHRHHEIGVRIALGAGRLRVLRQLLVESLLLSVAGGVTGTLLAFWSARATAALFPLSFSSEIRPDGSVVVFAIVVSVGATLLFGLAPALQWSRADVVSLLRRTGVVRLRTSAQNTLVVGQVAVAIVLVTGAGLFVRSMRAAQDVDLGFEPSGKVLMSVELESHGYSSEEGAVFSRLVLERASALPGVVRATTSDMTPFRGTWTNTVTAPGTDFAEQSLRSGFNRVGPGYFEVMGIPIVAGRGFQPTDDPSAPHVIVVNQELADRVWPGETALGKTLVTGNREWTVVGVARNAAYYDVGEEAVTQTYLPQTQHYDSEITFVVQTHGDAAVHLGSVERAIRSVDPNVAISNITTLEAVVDAELSQYRVLAILVTLSGCLALFLATMGLYGTQSFLIARRTREIGIRLALGAVQRQVAGSVLGRGVVLTLVGITVGVATAYVLSHFVRGMLFGVSPHDPLTFFSVPFVLLAVAVAASLIPARRASRVDPMEALREE
jgi:predicted permease